MQNVDLDFIEFLSFKCLKVQMTYWEICQSIIVVIFSFLRNYVDIKVFFYTELVQIVVLNNTHIKTTSNIAAWACFKIIYVTIGIIALIYCTFQQQRLYIRHK